MKADNVSDPQILYNKKQEFLIENSSCKTNVNSNKLNKNKFKN